MGIISRELGEKIMRAGRLDDEALERANEVEAGDMKNMQEMKNMQRMKNIFGRRRYELMKDEDTEDYWGQDEDRDGFMSRLVESQVTMYLSFHMHRYSLLLSLSVLNSRILGRSDVIKCKNSEKMLG